MSTCINNTPIDHYPSLELWVKREDLCCPKGPKFSKARGVYAHIKNRPEKTIGVLDTAHSRGGWAVAQACAALDRRCIVYYPVRKSEDPKDIKPQQKAAADFGSKLISLPAGRSAILYYLACKHLREVNKSYMMPNALKLPESVEETANEVHRTKLPQVTNVLVSASSGTIAAGVLKGLYDTDWAGRLVVHLGYKRSKGAVANYLSKASKIFLHQGKQFYNTRDKRMTIEIVDEGYLYRDQARAGDWEPPIFPCDPYYDLKLWAWWYIKGRKQYDPALMWNIG